MDTPTRRTIQVASNRSSVVLEAPVRLITPHTTIISSYRTATSVWLRPEPRVFARAIPSERRCGLPDADIEIELGHRILLGPCDIRRLSRPGRGDESHVLLTPSGGRDLSVRLILRGECRPCVVQFVFDCWDAWTEDDVRSFLRRHVGG